MNSTLKDTYRELVYPLKDASTWEVPNDLLQVLPPLMLKQPTGIPKNTNRILSKGEMPSQAGCGHTKAETWVKQYIHHVGTFNKGALLDEERARNGRMYQDWDDLVQEEPGLPSHEVVVLQKRLRLSMVSSPFCFSIPRLFPSS
uniref:Uncharacterized protein n=1 Tax=Tanacetum cinerariifolium TaxID=118510 RepID=A0A699HRF1_TANCI|nr:hypothetical protein [Tanacetum cinerariifolium]